MGKLEDMVMDETLLHTIALITVILGGILFWLYVAIFFLPGLEEKAENKIIQMCNDKHRNIETALGKLQQWQTETYEERAITKRDY